MIVDSFDSRTLACMELALERACKVLPQGSERHDVRSHIAREILACAELGDRTLASLITAGMVAASELCLTHGA
jgi:hypothetical protein